MLNQLDEKKIAVRFNKAAFTYDRAAVLQRTVGSALLERLQGIRLQPKTILDLGCGTGHFAFLLSEAYPSAEIIGFDHADEMLRCAKTKEKRGDVSKVHWLAGQAELLPFPESSFDLVYSNLMLHWSVDLQKTLHAINRVLKPGGLLLFSIVGADTLKELRYCWSTVDNKSHVHVFPDMHDVGDVLLQAVFADPVMDVDYFTLLHSDVSSIMKDLRALGVQNLAIDRHRGLTAKKSLQTIIHAYESFRHSSGKLPATWEIIYGHAWAPHPVVHQEHDGVSEISVRVDSIGGLRHTLRHPPS